MSETSLPLGELCEVRIGRTPRRDTPKYWGGPGVWVTISELNGGEIEDSHEHISQLALDEVMPQAVKPGTLLFSFKLSIGKMAIAGVPLHTNEAIAALEIRDSATLDRDYLRFALSATAGAAETNHAVLGKVLNKAKVEALPIPMRPLTEQRRVVDLLSRAEGIVRMRREAAAKTKEIIPALFVDMFGGRIRASDQNGDGLRAAEYSNAVTSFGDSNLIQIIDGDRGSKYPKKDEFQKDGYCLFLNTSNVRRGDWDFTHCDFISRTKDEELRKGKLKRQDIVLTTRGTLGNTAFFGKNVPYENVRINSGMVILRSVSEHLLPEYLLGVLNSADFLRQVKSATSGSAQQQLPIGTLSRITLPLLELVKQRCFAGHARRVQELEESAISATYLADQAFQSLLAGVFHQ